MRPPAPPRPAPPPPPPPPIPGWFAPAALALAAALGLAGCPVSQYDPAAWPEEFVAFGAPRDPVVGPWRPEHLQALRAEVPALEAWGPRVTVVDEGDPRDPFVLRPFDSQASDPAHRPCGAGAGRYTPSTSGGPGFGECDTACTGDDLGLQGCLIHEWGHKHGLRHVTPAHNPCPSCDPRVSPNDAVMNPDLGYDDPNLDPTATVDPGAVPQTDPTLADLQEWNLTLHHADAGP